MTEPRDPWRRRCAHTCQLLFSSGDRPQPKREQEEATGNETQQAQQGRTKIWRGGRVDKRLSGRTPNNSSLPCRSPQTQRGPEQACLGVIAHRGCAARDPAAAAVDEACCCCEAARRGRAEGTNAYVCVSNACKAANTAVALANMVDASSNFTCELKQRRSCYVCARYPHTATHLSLSVHKTRAERAQIPRVGQPGVLLYSKLRGAQHK